MLAFVIKIYLKSQALNPLALRSWIPIKLFAKSELAVFNQSTLDVTLIILLVLLLKNGMLSMLSMIFEVEARSFCCGSITNIKETC